nr:CLK4-associating serine/arginine rich protein [Leptinotarsa decemlineata]
MSIMWHEARRQERKIRGMLVDYRRRAERRRDFYERIKADPTQFLQVHGRRCKIHLDPSVAAAADSAVMMPWQGQSDILIDRFDVRAHLDYISPVGKQDEEELTQEDRQINYERYRIIAQNSFLGLTEEKFLKQLHLEEQYGYTEMKTRKESRTGGAAIGFNYEDGTGTTVPANPDEEESDENNSDSDLDVDLAINVSKMEPAQAHEMNKHGRNYGMSSNDFYSFLTNDLEEAEAVRLAREEEQEKALFSGRKSRRERRYHREKRLANRVISPPSYAAKASPTLPNFRDSKSKSHSRSPSPENSGKITYITSFGDDEDVPSSSKETYADKVKYGKPKTKIQMNERSSHLENKNKSRSRERSYGSKRKRSRSVSRSKSKSLNSRSTTRKSRSRSKSRRSSSKRRSRSRSRARRSLSRSKRSRSWSRNRKSRSRSRTRRSRSRSKIRRNRSKTRSNRSRSKSSSRSRSRKSRSRSRDRTGRSLPRNIGKSFRRRHSTSSSSSASSRSRSRSHSEQQNKDTVLPIPKESPEKDLPNVSESVKVIPRYYGRKKSDQSSSEISDSDDKSDVEMKPASNPVSSESKSGHGNSSGSAIKKNSRLTVIERLKRKRQALLNKQFKADKIAEQLKTEREKQEQQTREDELREMAIKLRRRQREIRHANDSRSSSSDSDSSNKSKNSEKEKTKSRSTSQDKDDSRKHNSFRDNRDKKEYPDGKDSRSNKDRRDSKEQRSREYRDSEKDNFRNRRNSRETRRDRKDCHSSSPRRGYRENWRSEREKESDRGSRLVDY